MFKINDRVKLLGEIAPLKHRKNRCGVITRIDGEYIYVRPMWCKWEVECYSCELEKI